MTTPTPSSMRIYLGAPEFGLLESSLRAEQRFSVERLIVDEGVMNYFLPGVDIVFCLKQVGEKDE